MLYFVNNKMKIFRKTESALLYCLAIIFSLQICVLDIPPAFPQPKEYLRLRTTQEGAIIQPKLTPSGEPIPEYYIAAGDKLEIYVWQNPDLTRTIGVRSDGKLSYPLIGTIKAEGLTIDQLQDLLKEKLSKYVRVPEVTVSVVESAGSKIIVLGQINYPGVHTFTGTISALDAIAMAGDFNQDARRDSVIVVSDNYTEHPKVRKLNLLQAIREGASKEDIFLKPNDLVYVPRSVIADFNKFLNDVQPSLNMISTVLGLGTTAGATAREGRAWFMHRDVKMLRGDPR